MSQDPDDRSCAYCGLPLGTAVAALRLPSSLGWPWGSTIRSPDRRDRPPAVLEPGPDVPPQSGDRHPQEYCCLGCRFAAAVAAEHGDESSARWTLTRLGLAIFFTMNVMVFTLAMWTQDVYDGESLSSARAGLLFELFRYLCLLFTAPVIVLLGVPLLQSAIDDWQRRVFTTDLLIALGVGAAFCYSIVSVSTGGEHVYFEVACMVLVAVTLGRWLEAAGKQQATRALRSLEKLLPSRVRVVAQTHSPPPPVHAAPAWQAAAQEQSIVPLEQVTVGQLIRILPGERIPLDGVIRRGQAAVDQQLVTGESEPSIKEQGDLVSAGTLNLDGDLFVEVREAPRDGAVHRIIDAVQQAAMAKCRLQAAADRVAAWFVPGVTAFAIAVFFVHTALGGLAAGVMTSLAVLLIACPCALGIATPMAVHAAFGSSASRGVLFRDGDAIERLAVIKAICFDKTGTLTTGQPIVDDFISDEETPRPQVLEVAMTIASASTHGLSAAIRRFGATQTGFRSSSYPEQVRTLPGRGIVARAGCIDGQVYLGSLRLMEEAGLAPRHGVRQAIIDARRQVLPLACIGWDGRVRGVFVFREQLRASSRRVLADLQQKGVYVTVLTGDFTGRAAVIEQLPGIDVAAELLPEDKLAAIQAVRHEYGPVAMVGDGINDAPPLAAADVGIAMGCGADVSRDVADVCLLTDDLSQVCWSFDLAKRTMRTVHQNLFWAFAYNTIGILLAATGWLNPIWAAVAMVGSSLFVITNSLRLSSVASAEDPETGETLAQEDYGDPVVDSATLRSSLAVND